MNSTTAVRPRLEDLLEMLKQNIFASMNCVKIGSIDSFDKTKKTANIQIMFKQISRAGEISSYPLIINCPVFTLQGGTSALKMPIQKGDNCLVLFADRNIDIWHTKGIESAPNDQRCHDIADGIAIVGINSLQSSMTAYDDNVNLVLPSSKKFVVSGGTAAEILGSSALALISELNAFINAYNLHVHLDPVSGSTGTPTVQYSAATGTTKLKGA